MSREPSRTVPRAPRARSRTAAVLAALAAVATLSGAVPAPGSGHGAPVRYVALGDSGAAAPGVPEQIDARCARSDHNYPSLVAGRLRPAAFTDVTCSGATTTDLGDARHGQFQALSKRTTLVTLTIGGNDVGFAGIVTKCTALGLFHPGGAYCQAAYTRGGTDELETRIAGAEPRIAGALHAIHRLAPHARVLLVGYLRLVPLDHRGCRPRELFGDGDLAYLDAFERNLNEMFRRTARANGAVFVDDHPASAHHDICRPSGVRWSEGLIPTSSAIPFHPNALGERAMAERVLAAAGR
ncbi:SGNH/GDSL hydrolase family protein [Streptantibioticus ferralitis]|uniref:SGNH/GDSL hydrolase family protein n=1 Tax=Streptantibioticus ferralitis TaxID=236510 RepID=A0ABT5ZAE3_9ACTN|nr:SGNH/GDSL hydrolase family protein [Streptantibioticus ferralitis]MDF2260817.1 SGNH/GDSL hydrolase family protein [Streptantibioticus ferralitis]